MITIFLLLFFRAIGEYVTRIHKIIPYFFPLSFTLRLFLSPSFSVSSTSVYRSVISNSGKRKESSSETKFKIKTFYLVSTHNFHKLLMHCNLVSDANTIIILYAVLCSLFKFHDLFFWCRDIFFLFY